MAMEQLVPSVVVVAPMLMEMERWARQLPLRISLPFSQGCSPTRPPLLWNGTLGILGIVTGMRPACAATSIMAVGHDSRFDLHSTYWVIAGIAGVNPAVGSIGSVFVAQHLIDLNGGYWLDGLGHIPNGRQSPDYSPPFPDPSSSASLQQQYLALNHDLSRRAFELARYTILPDTTKFQAARHGYTEAAARELPRVVFGDSVTGGTFWAGRESNTWSQNWTTYWSGGQAHFATTQEEDAAVLRALMALERGELANASRLIVLRGASDYTFQPGGLNVTLRKWFFGRTHMVMTDTLNNIFSAGLPIVSALAAEARDTDRERSQANALPAVEQNTGLDFVTAPSSHNEPSIMSLWFATLGGVCGGFALSRALNWWRAPKHALCIPAYVQHSTSMAATTPAIASIA